MSEQESRPNQVAGGHGWALHQELKRQAEQIASLHTANSALVERARAAERRALPIQAAAIDSLRRLLSEIRDNLDSGKAEEASVLLDEILCSTDSSRPDIAQVADFFRRR